MKTLVQELREQLETLIRHPDQGISIGGDAIRAVYVQVGSLRHAWFNRPRPSAHDWRIAVITAAIRAAVVTREAQP